MPSFIVNNNQPDVIDFDFQIQADRLSIHDTSSSSNSDSVVEDVDEFTDHSVSGGSPGEPSRCPVSNGNEAALHVEAGVLREIEALADTALKGGEPHSYHPYNNVPSSPLKPHHQQAQLSQQQNRITTSAIVRTNHCGPESMDSSNRNSATSLDSGRGSAYANSNDGCKNVSQLHDVHAIWIGHLIIFHCMVAMITLSIVLIHNLMIKRMTRSLLCFHSCF